MTLVQAFRIGRAVYGIPFHFEADRRLVAEWSVDFADVNAEFDADWPARMPREAEREGRDRSPPERSGCRRLQEPTGESR